MSLTVFQTTDNLPTLRTGLNANFASFVALHRATEQVFSDPAFVADDTLSVTMAANEVWHFSGCLFVSGDGGLTFDGPAGCDALFSCIGDGSITPNSAVQGSQISPVGTTVIQFSGVVQNGSTAGAFHLMGKNGDSSITVLAKSHIQFRRE